MKCPACGASGIACWMKDGKRMCVSCRTVWHTAAAKKKPRLDLPIHYLPPACVEDLEWLWKGSVAPKEAV